MSATIRVHDVRKSFGEQLVLDGLSFEVEEGGSLVIMGPSGSGKSVILKHVIGLLRPDSGEVEVMGRSVPDLSSAELQELRRDMGYLFQHAALINWLSVYDNVALPLRETTDLDEDVIAERVGESLERVQLQDHGQKLPGQLSGGMQKRAGLARALVTEPRVILYDEPEAGLDPEMSHDISTMIRELSDELGTTSVTVTHSVPCARTVGDAIAIFEKGRVIARGTPDEIVHSDEKRVRDFLGAHAD